MSSVQEGTLPTINYLKGLLGDSWDIKSDNDPPYIQLVASKGTTVAFHITMIWGDGNVEEAIHLCGQEVLHKSTRNDVELFFAVYHATRTEVHLYKIDPRTQQATKLESGTVQAKADQVKRYAEANYNVLAVPPGQWIWSVEYGRYYRYVTVEGRQQVEFGPVPQQQ
ncbi:hypothetical protein PTRG_11953 [Pyrenophora tritici-repentis Pt-1C-BFP]|uniref:Uncharacterized protein n=1 Tax=Pyrenophora tritici-repentis (strain Pt-1C-BFP) TaxID=426418 RepID=B2WPK2_PYRTR|nr:uncharacterized protein PTRG_11953 [Pyrenophora tritici-repentis Pt-1C-BFP]EDU46068.1 hypothetical protein PTRG_11953 [Pyrenophora tritici-repentis Pt-1C-BFP]